MRNPTIESLHRSDTTILLISRMFLFTAEVHIHSAQIIFLHGYNLSRLIFLLLLLNSLISAILFYYLFFDFLHTMTPTAHRTCAIYLLIILY